MASALAHAAVAMSLGTTFQPQQLPRRCWLFGIACTVVPDIDIVGFHFGVHYGDFLGHRGLTHSLAFAAVLSIVVALCVSSRLVRGTRITMLVLYLFIATASHGVLDAMTNGGLGVAFFSPFSRTRYFLPFRPIEVSPISIGAFFTHRGLEVLQSELLWIGLPFLAWAAVMMVWEERRRCRER